MTRTQRNGNIECLRFLFAVCILLLHCRNMPFQVRGGYLAVEFFFLLSGLFLGRSLREKQRQPQPLRESVQESGRYILRRIGAIFPYFLPASVIGFAVKLLYGEYRNGLYALAHIFYLPNEWFCLQNLGFSSPSGTGVSWYLSALFFSLWLLYPLLRRQYVVTVRYAALPVSLWIVGFLHMRFGSLNQPNTWIGPFNTGILRAIAMLLLGAAVNEGAVWLQEKRLGGGVRFALTAAEGTIYAGIFAYMFWGSAATKGHLDQVAVPLMALALVLTAGGQSLWYGKLDNRFSAFLGKFSMLLFLNHFCWVQCTGRLLQKVGVVLPKPTACCIGIALSVVMSLLDWAIGDGLRRLWKRAQASLKTAEAKNCMKEDDTWNAEQTPG